MYHNLLLLSLIISSLIIAILLFAGNYFYNFAILRRKKEFLKDDPDLRETASGASWDAKKEWLLQQIQEAYTIRSYDDLKLNATYIPCKAPTEKTAILVHGYNSWSGSMGGFAQYYTEVLGFNVLLPDLRGHGESEGSYIGFGWHDRKDILQWVDVLIEKLGHSTQIVLHGVSMGAASVLMTSGEELPNNVKCIVSDCAYSSVSGILGYQAKRMFKLPKFPLIYFTSLVCKMKAGYFIGEASALKQVHHSKLPILFIHGSVDKFVPTEMVHELYETALCQKELLVVADAAHGTSFWKDPEKYKAAVEGFLQKYI